MCGLVGIVDISGRRDIDRNLLCNMRDSLVHRGPDESGAYYFEGLAFGHRRLSIIDLKSGQQPMTDQTCEITVTYNGEIYNFKTLAKELQDLGCKFLTDSDTEVILHAWRQWGAECVKRFRGMFSFALFDKATDTVFLARDRLGIKPLYYSVTACGYFIFASEIKALKCHPGFCTDLNGDSVVNYFTLGYVPQPDSIYAGTHKLAAGHTLTLANRKLQEPREYWDVRFNDPVADIDLETVSRDLIENLSEAIDIRLIAEVPIGAFLSGGVDSSTIVALMSRLLSNSVNTCSIGFDSKQFDETDFARSVAAKFNTSHKERVLAEIDHRDVNHLAGIYDEPFADSSALPTLSVCQLAKETSTVVLSGDGADEALVGYRRQRMHMQEEQIRNAIPESLRKFIFGPLGRIYPKADWAPKPLRAKTTFQALAKNSVQAYLSSVSMLSSDQRNRLFSARFKQSCDLYLSEKLFAKYAEAANTDDPMRLMQYIDIKTYLVDDILTKVDRASMHHSLEVRVPFIDHIFLEWLVNLPNTMKIENGIGKRVLKKAMEGCLSSELLYRKKMGFSIPLKLWMLGPLEPMMRSAITSDLLLDSGIFDSDYLLKLHRDHTKGYSDNSTELWVILMFYEFLRNSAA